MLRSKTACGKLVAMTQGEPIEDRPANVAYSNVFQSPTRLEGIYGRVFETLEDENHARTSSEVIEGRGCVGQRTFTCAPSTLAPSWHSPNARRDPY